jgi:hypothetical protein
MKSRLRLLSLFALLLIAAGWAGCSGDDGESADYRGHWQGRTSHGGTVLFTVEANAVTSLRIVDSQASLQITQPVGIEGNSFFVENSEGVSSPGSPAVSAQGTFDTETHCAGRYSIVKASRAWSGTFEATRP